MVKKSTDIEITEKRMNRRLPEIYTPEKGGVRRSRVLLVLTSIEGEREGGRGWGWLVISFSFSFSFWRETETGIGN
jgi:hypothetical protein